MKYRVKEDGSLTTKSELKGQNPNISFPKVWSAETLKSLGVDPVLAGQKPDVGDYEVAVADGAVKNKEGNWVEAWKVQPMFTATKEATVEQQIADYEARKLLKKRQGLSATNENLRLQLDQSGYSRAHNAVYAYLIQL